MIKVLPIEQALAEMGLPDHNPEELRCGSCEFPGSDIALVMEEHGKTAMIIFGQGKEIDTSYSLTLTLHRACAIEAGHDLIRGES